MRCYNSLRCLFIFLFVFYVKSGYHAQVQNYESKLNFLFQHKNLLIYVTPNLLNRRFHGKTNAVAE